MTDALTRPKTETEYLLVGCMIHEPDIIGSVLEKVQQRDIFHRDVAKMFGAVVSLWEKGLPVSTVTVAEVLPEDLKDDVYQAEGMVGSIAQAPFYCDKIKAASVRRSLAKAGQEIIGKATQDDRDVAEIVGDAQDIVARVIVKDDGRSLHDHGRALLEASERAKKFGTVGVPTGFRTLDNMTSGINKGTYTLYAARPSIGKSAFGMNTVQNILEGTDYTAAMFSGEMSRDQILLRMISRRTGIDSLRLRKGDLSSDEWVKYTEASVKIPEEMEGRVWIDDRSRPSPGYIAAKVRQLQSRHTVDTVFIDYVQTMSIPGKFSGVPEKLSAISGALQAMAKDLDVGLVVMAQLSRAFDENSQAQPRMSDLKGSGSLEEDADVVVFIHRQGIEAETGSIIVGKHRLGPVGAFSVRYHGPTTTFMEV